MKRKNTKANVLDVLRKMRSLKWDLYQMHKREENAEWAQNYWGEYSALDVAIQMFEDQEYFNAMDEIFTDKKEEN